MSNGILYIVATPIGNLKDITLRALETLRAVDAVAAEDTRVSAKLLNHYEIKKKLISFHEYSSDSKRNEILELLKDGKNIALITDAGTPIVSDPGYMLVRDCAGQGIRVESIPGACAAITAVTLCAQDCAKFVFYGFLNAKQNARKEQLQEIKRLNLPSVVYESPQRVVKTLADICDVLGEETEVCLARELTKLHEEVFRGSAAQAKAEFEKRESIKGEFVLVIGAAPNEEKEATDEEILNMLKDCLAQGKTKKDAVKIVTASMLLPKNKVYKLLLEIED